MISAYSLTEHRIDIKFAEYITEAISKIDDADKVDFAFITNGMYDPTQESQSAHTMKILHIMKTVPSAYLIDDHTCWIPNKDDYPLCTIYSQFIIHPMTRERYKYFQVSKLALFDSKFDSLQPNKNPLIIWGYWGQYKPERAAEYVKHLYAGTKVIGRRYPTNISSKWKMLPFTKDLNELSNMIQGFTHTKVFGDKFHNGINLPYRIYEALMNGVQPVIDKELLGTQSIDIGWLMQYVDGEYTSNKYVALLNQRRDTIIKELMSMVVRIDKDNSVDDVLKERGAIYGSYISGVDCRAAILYALNEKHIEVNNRPMCEEQRIVFGDLALKLMRAASTPSHKDSWLDLAGYSKLINNMIEEHQDVFDSSRY